MLLGFGLSVKVTTTDMSLYYRIGVRDHSGEWRTAGVQSAVEHTGGAVSEPRRTANGAVDGRSMRSQRKSGLPEMIRQKVLDEIISGEIAQGQVIQIAQLAKKYETSRTPVREALMGLEQAGLITVLPYRGYMIRPITLPEAKDVFLMRSIIEGAAAERTAKRLTPPASEELWGNDQPAGAYSLGFDSACHDFHRKIAAAADSPRLLDALERIFHDIQRVQVIVTDPPSPTAIHDEHLKIQKAIATHDPSAARAAMEGHIRSLYRHSLESLLGEPLPTADEDIA
jgi:DNA-binding GntR family transcriptional regulator